MILRRINTQQHHISNKTPTSSPVLSGVSISLQWCEGFERNDKKPGWNWPAVKLPVVKLVTSCKTSHCKVTSCKSKGGHGIPVELYQILKDDAVKVLHSICHQIWKTQQWSQDWKRSVFISISKKGNAKERSNYCTIVLISHASKVKLKILQVRLQ